jgi:hypothetical protein
MVVGAIAWAVAVTWAQGTAAPGGWTASPPRATVGDTVWLERRFTLPGGWQVRPGRLQSSDEVEALGDPVVLRSGADWVVRYPVASWTPGAHQVTLPPAWQLGPEAQADSVAGGSAAFELRSVIPDSVTAPEPRPALLPLRSAPRDPRPPILAVLLAGVVLAGGVWWRRRSPRALRADEPSGAGAPISDQRWLAAGEPKAVAARAAGRLREAIARLVPEAHLALSTTDCLAVVRRLRPQAPADELETVLTALDRVAFAGAPGPDVTRLAQLATTLSGQLAP